MTAQDDIGQSLDDAFAAMLKPGKKLDETLARLAIIRCFYLWQLEDNPLFVWRALKLCRGQEITLPWWVTGYLDEAANRLLAVTPGTGTQDSARRVYVALGLSRTGSRSPFDRAELAERKVEATLRVEDLRETMPLVNNRQGQGAFEVVATQMNVSSSSVRTWYYKMKPLLDKYPASSIFLSVPGHLFPSSATS